MPSRISCPSGHSSDGISIHGAAVAVSEQRPLGTCQKCGQPLQYRIDHIYANNPAGKQRSFVVARAVRLGTRLHDGDNYDPFLLELRETETGKQQILPTFWGYGADKAWWGGQFPPLLSFEEWETLFRRLDAGFLGLKERISVRAYELYEQRGRRDGRALDDWLDAERELAGQRGLRAPETAFVSAQAAGM